MSRVAMLGIGPDADAAWALLATVPGVTAAPLTAADPIPGGGTDPDVIWVHASDQSPPLPRVQVLPWLERGGRLLLTLRAVRDAVALGLEPAAPNDVVATTWRHDADELWFPEFRDHLTFPHVRGIAAFGAHPLFAGMGRGTYLWAPSDGERFAQATYARGRRPAAAGVVGCERAYVHLNADRIVAWEYGVGAGGVLCIGAFVHPGAADPRFAAQLRTLLANALVGPAIPSAARRNPATCWPSPGSRADAGADVPAALAPDLSGTTAGRDSDLAVDTAAGTDAAFSLAGRRALVVGREAEGVAEIWLHPHRVLQRLGITVGGTPARALAVRIAPSLVERRLSAGSHTVLETVTTAVEDAVVLLEYRGAAASGRAAVLHLEWTVELRRAWPYDAAAEGNLRFRVSPDARAIVAVRAGGAAVTFVASHPVIWDLDAVPHRPAVRVRLDTTLDRPLRLAALGGTSERELATAERALARRGWSGLSRQRAQHERAVRDDGLRVRSPDATLDTAVEWAKLRLDGFVVETPEVGRSLVAGYAAARPGWGDGRPGYAWYFARDACWSAWAQLALGDQVTPRLVLQFLGASQDVTGKVIHELTTSGLAHYDAADSTPLYLLLAGRYARWTGDLAFLDAEWSRIERAYRFCLGTDRDGDGLIENTGVGHGWIEMGPLAGAHVTLYLASIWAAALAALAPVARALGRASLGDELVDRANRARAAIDTRLRLPDGHALGLLPDGTPQRRLTALTAVPVLLGVIEPQAATAWLDAVADPSFSAPWGVRLLRESDDLYQPAGYHTGSVWPLYTGWVSLAEYRAHRPAAGLAHLMANARLPFARQIGAFDEVLRGDRDEGAGVCPDQAWSAALFALPLIEGLLGAKPDAASGRLALAPHVPAAWDASEWRGLRVGSTALDLQFAADRDRVRVRVARAAGPALVVSLSLPLAPETAPHQVRVDGTPVRPRIVPAAGCRHAEVTFTAAAVHDLEMSSGDAREVS